ncbi:MAG TPA: biopolymer transporter ExbD [Gammaproteobacteria bacterium]|jgi:biopolymer transport protein TolR|nr:biopolymer transporter ExbD [Gammaproteobacteria bacterium]
MKYMGRAARMQRHHKRHKGDASINLVSMIDMLTVLVFFLLVYSTEQIEVLPSAKDVQLPESTAEKQIVHQAVVVVVTEHEVLISGKSVGTIEEILASASPTIPTLQAELEAEAAAMLRQDGLTEDEKIVDRKVTILADKELPYRLVRKVMATSTAASYGQLSLAVLQKGSDLAVASVARN